MEVQIFDHSDELSVHVANFIHRQVVLKPDLLLCAATGNSPLGAYAELGKIAKLEPATFSQIRVIKLDEWDQIGMNHPSSCEYYLDKHLLSPLNIDSSRYEGFNNEAPDLGVECDRVQRLMGEMGPIDLCILGIGTNGHIGFNEPSEKLSAACHLVPLSPTSLSHSMLEGLSVKPGYGITIGMAGIFQAKHIILIISGQQKKSVFHSLMTGNITTQLPASLLLMHPRVLCFADKSAAS